MYRFDQLNSKAKLKAIKDYKQGYFEAYDDYLLEEEAIDLLNNNDALYDINGNFIEE